jgi:hypothetical protein
MSMSWLLYLPTRELADAMLMSDREPLRAIVEVSGNWDTARVAQDGSFPLQPVSLHPAKEDAIGHP